MSRVAGEGMGESYAAERLGVAVFGHVVGGLALGSFVVLVAWARRVRGRFLGKCVLSIDSISLRWAMRFKGNDSTILK